MTRRTEKVLPAQLAAVLRRLSHPAHITYTVNGETHEDIVTWYGYPKEWKTYNEAQQHEWWRQHCVRQYAMPLNATLTGVRIFCS